MINLTANAIKFTDKGHVMIKASVNFNGEVELSVHDTGIGMEPDQITELFQMFHQIDQSANRRNEGTGLGLDISRRLARLMGGDIEARSSKGSAPALRFTCLCDWLIMKTIHRDRRRTC